MFARVAVLSHLLGIGCSPVNPTENTIADDEAIVVSAPERIDLSVASQATTANRDFAVDLYLQLAKERADQNLLFSPYSLFNALAMTVEGAQAETAAEMGRVLRFPDAVRQTGDDAESILWNTERIHLGLSALNQRFNPKPMPEKLRQQIATLRKNLETANEQVTALQTARKFSEALHASENGQKLAAKLNAILTHVDQYEIRVANALWGAKGYPFASSYLETIRKYYRTGALFPVDFAGHPESARQQINAWVEDQTGQRIRDLIPPGGIHNLTRLVLTNAIYFKGEWQAPFSEHSTRVNSFTNSVGATSQIPLMNERYKSDVHYAAFNADGTFFATPLEVPARRAPDPKTVYPRSDGFLMLEIPYKGGELSMVVLMPQDAARLKEFEKYLSGDVLQNWIAKLQQRVVHVTLPKFRLETEYPLHSTLAAMGMARAFNNPSSPDGPQFDRMCSNPDPAHALFISDVFHKAFVEVSEKGTEAAAATAVAAAIADGEFDEITTVPFTPTFRADKPFLFLIRDIQTGAILFFGRFASPQE